MIPSLYDDLPLADYLAAPGISASFLSLLLAYSPAHARCERERTSTAAMDTGSLVDAMILDAIELAGRFVVRPSEWSDWRAKEARAWREAQQEAGKTVVTAEQWAQCEAMRDALYAHTLARDLLWDPARRAQVSMFWTDPTTGLECKARPDAWIDTILVNLKTTCDARPHAFRRTAEGLGYWISAAHYLEGAAQITGAEHYHIWVVVESAPPFGVRVYSAHDERNHDAALDAAHADWRQAMEIAAQCLARGEWHGYPPQIESLTRPRWALESYVDE